MSSKKDLVGESSIGIDEGSYGKDDGTFRIEYANACAFRKQENIFSGQMHSPKLSS
jgi:hypothetical protein